MYGDSTRIEEVWFMYRQDKEYMAEVGHLIDHPKLQKLKDIPHHIHSNRLEH